MVAPGSPVRQYRVMGRRAMVAAITMALLIVPGAQARKVLAPTANLDLVLTGGTFAKRNQDPPVVLTIPSGGFLAQGAAIDAAGAVVIPAGSLTFPPQHFPDEQGSSNGVAWTLTNMTLTAVPTQDVTGVLNPFTGSFALDARFKMFVSYTACVQGGPCYSPGAPGAPDDCHLGTDQDPILVPLASAVPYSQLDGSFRLSNTTFALPGGSTGCDPQFYGIRVSGTFNNATYLPSPSGSNEITVQGRLDPIMLRGVIAALTANPAGGVDHVTTTLDASGSQAPAGVAHYEFDRDGNGTYETTSSSPTVQATLSAPGDYALGVRVVDTDGDADTTQRHVVVATPTPSPTATATPTATPGLPRLSFSALATLRARRPCVAGRRMAIRLHPPAGVTLASVRVTAGSRTRSFSGAAVQGRTLRLRGLPRGRYRLRAVIRTTDGRSATGSRRYAACSRRG